MENEKNLIDMEKAIIGELLFNLNTTNEFYNILFPAAFTDLFCQKVFTELQRQFKKDKAIDFWVCCQQLSDENMSAEQIASVIKDFWLSCRCEGGGVGSAKYLLGEYYKRTLINTVSGFNGAEFFERSQELQTLISTASLNEKVGKFADEIADELENEYFTEKADKILLGFPSLDEIITIRSGSGKFIVVGARTSVGKSAFALQILSHNADNNKRVLMFSQEMDDSEIYERIIAQKSGIKMHIIQESEFFKGNQKEQYASAVDSFRNWKKNFCLVENRQTVASIRYKANYIKPDIIIIDYMQLIKSDSKKKEQRYAEVGEISHGIKELSKELQIPIIVLSQLNRESSKDKENIKPSMSQMRESGDIEQDADAIILLWEKEKEEEKNGIKKVGVKVDKNRQGRRGEFDFIFDGGLQTFIDKNGFNEYDGKFPS